LHVNVHKIQQEARKRDDRSRLAKRPGAESHDVQNHCTRVAVHKVEGNFCVFKPFSDFSVTLATASLRATDVNVRRQHQAVLADLPELVKCATVHYQVRRADSPPSVAVTAA
jgi:hypothetical protein